MRWQFKDETPLSFKVTGSLFALNFLVDFAGFYALPWWSTRLPSFPLSSLQRRRRAFRSPWLGKYFECGFWAHFVLLTLLFLIMWLQRDDMERIC